MINSDNTGFKPVSNSSSILAQSELLYNDYGELLYRAGQVAPAGTYLEADSNLQVQLDRTGPLPASLDGRRAYYTRLEQVWLAFTPERNPTTHSSH